MSFLHFIAGSSSQVGTPVVGGDPVNPTLASVAFSAPGGGEKQRVTLSYSYPFDPQPDTLVAGIVITDNALTAAQIKAGTGTFIERATVDPLTEGELDISNLFTSASNGDHSIYAAIWEKNNGGISSEAFDPATGIDFSAETRVSVETNTAGNELTVTWSGAVFDPAGLPDVSASDFAMSGHTLTLLGISGSTVVLGVSPAVGSGDSDALDYTGTALKDTAGNTIATFSSVSVTNNVSGAGLTVTRGSAISDNTSTATKTFTDVPLGTGWAYVAICYNATASRALSETGVTIAGVTAEQVTDGTDVARTSVSSGRTRIYFYRAEVDAATGDIVIPTSDAGLALGWTIFVWMVSGTHTVQDVRWISVDNGTPPWAQDISVNTTDGGAVLMAINCRGGSPDYDASVGWTLRDSSTPNSDAAASFGDALTGVTTEAPRSVTIADSDEGDGNGIAAIVVSIAPA